MKTRNLFIYWEGPEFKLIKLLRELIYMHSNSGIGYNVIFINRGNLDQYIEIPHYFDSLCLAHQADYVRVNVICDRGGIWLDSDTLVMKSLDSLFNILDTQEGFFIKENNQILFNGVFGSNKNTPLMESWKMEMNQILNTKGNSIHWTEVGNSILDQFENTTNLYQNYKIFNGLDSLYPVNWNFCVDEFLTKSYENYKNITRSYQPLIVLVNSVYRQYEQLENTENNALNYFMKTSMINANYNKLLNSDEFIENLKLLNNNLRKSLENKNLDPVLIGNLFYDHAQYNFHTHGLLQDCEEKRIRLVEASKRSKIMFEIGLNGGHSGFLALMANKDLFLYANDIAEYYPSCPGIHPEVYVEEGANTLKTIFDDRFVFIKGNCLTEVPNFVKSNQELKIDLVHIDGAKETYKTDFFNIMPLLQDGALVIFDDSNMYSVQEMINGLIRDNYLQRSTDFPVMDASIKYRNEILLYKKQ